jgi:hypothetical protein
VHGRARRHHAGAVVAQEAGGDEVVDRAVDRGEARLDTPRAGEWLSTRRRGRGAVAVGRGGAASGGEEEEEEVDVVSRCPMPLPPIRLPTTISVHAATAPIAATGDAATRRPAAPPTVKGVSDTSSSVTSNPTGLSRSENTIAPLSTTTPNSPRAIRSSAASSPPSSSARGERPPRCRAAGTLVQGNVCSYAGRRALTPPPSRHRSLTRLVARHQGSAVSSARRCRRALTFRRGDGRHARNRASRWMGTSPPNVAR